MTTNISMPSPRPITRFTTLLAAILMALAGTSARASIAYGTLNNFDTVNDTGQECHGFEIELEDCRSTDITYCYSYNHYGTPTITEDTASVPGHTNCIVRYAAVMTNGAWSAFTAIPSGPIAPTQGHQFTNPSLNFGGEHFGVGYYGRPSAVHYFWLLDNGGGVLVRGPEVKVSTPAFTYNPPAGGLAGRVQAAIEPPPAPPVREFGPASWVKSIVTTTHNNHEVKLRDLMSEDPDYPDDKDWRNGEPDEVETEWFLLQQEFSQPDQELIGAEEELPEGDEIITRRYEFYEYAGPIDNETGEALASKVGPDGIHGVNEGNNDYSGTVIVGDYLGAQMSAFDHELPIGLIDHVADGEVNVEYPTRSVVVAGIPFTATNSGALPTGMTFDTTTGQLSGTPTESGIFTFTVRVSATNMATLEKSYSFAIADVNEVLPPHSTVDTVSDPLDCGETAGTGLYTNDDLAEVTATAYPGYRFLKWTDNDKTVSTDITYQFPVELNRSLVAHFVPAAELKLMSVSPTAMIIVWPTNFAGGQLQESTDMAGTNWSDLGNPATIVGTNNEVTVPIGTGSRFFRLVQP